MFGRVLIANRGDNRARSAPVAVKAVGTSFAQGAQGLALGAARRAHVGSTDVKARSAGRNHIARDRQIAGERAARH
jgi:hypothetical protein